MALIDFKVLPGIDKQNTDSGAEFVEIVNLTEVALSLDRLSLTVEENERLRFSGGCLPPLGAVAIYGDEANWQWDPLPEETPAVTLRSLSLVNSRPFRLALISSTGEALDRFEGESELIVSGVSLTRRPDPGGAEIRLHARRGDQQSSPARCENGGRYPMRCSDGQPLPDQGVVPELGPPADSA